VRVHLAREHALELEFLDGRFDASGIRLEVAEPGLVVLGLDEVEQLGDVGQATRDAVERADRRIESRAFAAQFLGALGRVPDLRVLQLAVDLFEALALGGVLKDTP